MKNSSKFCLLLVLVLFIGTKPNLKKDANYLIGYWVKEFVKEKTFQCVKKDTFMHHKGGYFFGRKSKLIVRGIGGFCGSPISYFNYSGTWRRKSNSTILLKYPFWNGNVKELISIEQLSDSMMEYKVLHRTVSKFKQERY